MKQALWIAASEWRYWLRSNLIISASIIFIALNVITTVSTAIRMSHERHERIDHQSEAENTFLSQPDRHPHRMVHYGHYVFRTPAPLAIFDPGLDPVTGQAIFLEGHRQNSATFAQSSASADLGGFAWLSPALMYQFIAPLLIILLSHGAITREREAGSLTTLLAQGLHPSKLMVGKTLAALSFIAILMLPLLVSCSIALWLGEEVLAAIFIFTTYFVYLSVWALTSLWASALIKKRGSLLASLAALWLATALVLPSFAVNLANRAVPLAGKIETDLNMLVDKRKLGDGHNAQDPAFQKLRADLIEKHGVTDVADLPVNIRGVVALNAEEKLTDLLNQYAEQRMATESRQAAIITRLGWLSPAIAITSLSRSVAGTDLSHYHHFLREAERVRFEFVQGLNQAHAQKLSYEDDIRRNKDEESWQRARVGAANWNVLDRFSFQPESSTTRLIRGSESLLILLVWLAVSIVLLQIASRRLTR